MKNLLQKVGSSFKATILSTAHSSHGSSTSLSNENIVVNRVVKGNIATDYSPQIIAIAARTLSDGIQEILADSNSLYADDLSGFYKLLDLLTQTAEVSVEDPNSILSYGGVGCTSFLLKYIAHDSFCDKCAEVQLAPALIHALRLLRMMEVKSLAKRESAKNSNDSVETKIQGDTDIPTVAVTYHASECVCRILSVLCSNPKIINQLREQLIKLLCLPLSTVPITAVHLQEHVATVVCAMCSITASGPYRGFSALSDSILNFLHESNLMHHIHRALRELVIGPSATATNVGVAVGVGNAIKGQSSSTGQPLHEMLIYGEDAEARGMWLIACNCVVDIIIASMASFSHSTVLLNDFESVGGYSTLIHIFLHTSRERGMLLMNTITRLFSGEDRSLERPIGRPEVGNLIDQLLTTILETSPLRGDSRTDFLQLVTYANEVTNKAPYWSKFEYVLQNVTYALLTLYSNHPMNYGILEENLYLLPTLTLCIPGSVTAELTHAVFKIINYLCLCLEQPPFIALTSISSAVYVMVDQLLERCHDEDKISSTYLHEKMSVSSLADDENRDTRLRCIYLNLQSTMTALYELIRSDAKHATLIFNSGLFEYVVLAKIESLRDTCLEKVPMRPVDLGVYQLLLDLISTSLSGSHDVIKVIRLNRLITSIKTLVTSEFTLVALVRSCAKLLEQVVRADPTEMDNNLQLFVDLISVVRYRPNRAEPLVNSITSLIEDGDSLRLQVWQSLGGFECVLSVVTAMNGLFVSDKEKDNKVGQLEGTMSDQLGEMFDCLKSVISCFTSASRISRRPRVRAYDIPTTGDDSYESYLAQSVSKYFSDNQLYVKLTYHLRLSGVFQTNYMMECVMLLFQLMQHPTESSKISIPEAVHALISLLQDLPVTAAIDVISMMKTCALASIDGCKLLSEAGAVTAIFSKFPGLILDYESPVGSALLDFVRTLSHSYLILSDFVSLIRHCIRPLIVLSADSQMMMPPWTAIDHSGVIGSKTWESVALLLELAELPSLNTASPPYLALGSDAGVKASDDAFLRIHWKEVTPGRAFPASQFSFSCWVRVRAIGADKTSQAPPDRPKSGLLARADFVGENVKRFQMIPLLCLRASTVGVFFDAQIDMNSSVLRLSVRKGKSLSSASFDIPYVIDGEWHLIVLSFHRSVRYGGLSKTLTSVYIDGERVSTEKMESEVPVQGQQVEIFIGQSQIDGLDSIDVSVTEESMIIVESVPWWQLGPFNLFDEILSQSQITHIFVLGPSYCGTFQSESTVEYLLSTRSTDILCKCNRKITDISVMLESLGLPGLELVVYPEVEAIGGPAVAPEVPGIPSPVLGYSVESIGYGIDSEDRAGRGMSSFFLHNVVTQERERDLGLMAAVVQNGWFISTVCPVPACVASMGGPGIIFPLVQAASTDTQLSLSLRLLRACIRFHSSNLNFMHNKGYLMLSYILCNKPKQVITEEVIRALFDLSIDKGSAQSRNNSFNALLVDSQALFFLILNHNIWDAKRFDFVTIVLNLLRSLVDEDCRHNQLNARRLSGLGVVRWILLMLLSNTEPTETSTPAGLSSTLQEKTSDTCSLSWQFRPIPLDDADSGSCLEDSFLSSTLRLVNTIMLCEFRQRDVDVIAYTILFTLSQNHSSASDDDSKVREVSRSRSSSVIALSDSFGGCLNSRGILRVHLLRNTLSMHNRSTSEQYGHSRAFSGQDKTVYTTVGHEWKPMSDADIRRVYKKAFDTNWFLTVLEGCVGDAISTSLCLRLLGSFLQKDSSFQKEFCSANIFASLKAILIGRPQPSSVIMPLLAIALQCPMASLPTVITQDFSLMDFLHAGMVSPTSSPNSSTYYIIPLAAPTAEDIHDCHLPFLCLTLEVLASSIRLLAIDGKPRESQRKVMELLSEGFHCSDFFVRMITQRPILETLVSIIVSFSDASGMNASLTSMMSSDSPLGTSDGLEMAPTVANLSSSRSDTVLSPSTYSYNELSFCLTVPDGIHMAAMLFQALSICIFHVSYNNPLALSQLLLAFPKDLSDSRVGVFHLYIFHKICTFLETAFDEENYEAVATVANMLNSLVPLVKSNVVDEDLVHEAFKCSVKALEMLKDSRTTQFLGTSRANSLYKDFAMSAKYFAIMLVQPQQYTMEKRTKLSSVLASLRINMFFLCENIIEELTDVPMSALSPSSSTAGMPNFDERFVQSQTFGMSIRELQHLGWNESTEVLHAVVGAAGAAGAGIFGKRPNSTTDVSFSHTQSEKTKLCQFFTLIFLSSLHSLLLDDHYDIRREALRICCLLLIHRRQFMESLFGISSSSASLSSRLVRWETAESEKSSELQGVQLLEGFTKLLPPVRSTTQYVRSLESAEHKSTKDEDAAFAEFSYWLTNHNLHSEAWFTHIEGAVAPLLPIHRSVTSTIRHLRSQKAQHDEESQLSAMTSRSHNREQYRITAKIRLNTKVWRIFGLAQAAAGALLWRELWMTLQSGTLWGWVPQIHDAVEEDPVLRAVGANRTQNIPSLQVIPKRLVNIEGPEKARMLLETDIDEVLGDVASSLDTPEIDGKDVKVSGLAVKSQLEIPQDHSSDFSNNNVEEFLKRIANNGLLSINLDEPDEAEVTVTVTTDGDTDDMFDDNEDDLDMDLSTTRPTTDLSPPLNQKIIMSPLSASSLGKHHSFNLGGELSPEDISNDTLAIDGLVGSPRVSLNFEGDTQGEDTIEVSAEDRKEDNEQSVFDFEMFHRGKLLTDIARTMLAPEDWKSASIMSVQRIFGLESQPALLVVTPTCLHLLDGLQVAWLPYGSGKERVLKWMGTHQRTPKDWRQSTTTPIAVDFSGDEDGLWMSDIISSIVHGHMCHHSVTLDQVFTIYRRRHHLKNTALEVTDTTGYSVLFACEKEEEVECTIKLLLESDLPSSVFNRVGMKNLPLSLGSSQYKLLMAKFLAAATKAWLKGELSNFEYLMHLNAAAGRSYQDLTQYPVFPWVLSDYSSDSLDLDDPASYRDLRLPMGAIGVRRANQYVERFRTMNELVREGLSDLPPPFFYGTHYSCAGYVLHYLLRLQPYSRLALQLQGGHYDKADRLFKNIEASWTSASEDNLQDVRELIPEFFCLPDFLCNKNNADFGVTQSGERVHDVSLPPWARGDPTDFVRIHRQALESTYVSENLHHWIDLIFGCKQRGQAAADAMNVFVHITYDGMVDIDAIADPILRDATITQVNSFGQTPGRLFLRPHPSRQVPDIFRRGPDGIPVSVDAHALSWFEPLSPPLCVVGASNLVCLSKMAFQQATYPSSCRGRAVGDVRLGGRDKLLCVPLSALLIPPRHNKYLCFGRPAGGLSFHSMQGNTPMALEGDHVDSLHEGLHTGGPILVACISKDGSILATGGSDGSIRLWSLSRRRRLNLHQIHSHKLYLLAELCGHISAIRCMDLCLELNVLASGSADGSVILWNTRQARIHSGLGKYNGPIVSVSINNVSGMVAVLTKTTLITFTVNGDRIASVTMAALSIPRATFVLAPPVGDWQEGVAAVTGHSDGHILLWKIRKPMQRPVMSWSDSHSRDNKGGGVPTKPEDEVTRILEVVCTPMKVHRAEISVIRLSSSSQSQVNKSKPLVNRLFEGGNTLELLVGDVNGYVSRWCPVRLEQLALQEVQQVFALPITSVPSAPSRAFSPSPSSTNLAVGPLARAETFMTESLQRLSSNSSI